MAIQDILGDQYKPDLLSFLASVPEQPEVPTAPTSQLPQGYKADLSSFLNDRLELGEIPLRPGFKTEHLSLEEEEARRAAELPLPAYAPGTPKDVRPVSDPDFYLPKKTADVKLPPMGTEIRAATGAEPQLAEIDLQLSDKVPLYKQIMDVSEIMMFDPGLASKTAIKDALKGVSFGNIEYAYDLAEKVLDKPGFKNAMMSEDPQEWERWKGYYPKKGRQAVGGVTQIAGALLPLSGIFRGASAATKAINIPALKAVARSTIAGTATGLLHKPEDDSIVNRLKQVPGDVLFFTAMEMGILTAGKALEILKWNRRHGKLPKGRRVDYTEQEVRDIYRKMDRNSTPSGVVESYTDVEKLFVEEMKGTSGSPLWNDAIREGYSGKVGRGVAGKPRMADIFRRPTEPIIRPEEAPPTEPPPGARPTAEQPPGVTVDVVPKPEGGYTYNFKIAPPPEAQTPTVAPTVEAAVKPGAQKVSTLGIESALAQDLLKKAPKLLPAKQAPKPAFKIGDKVEAEYPNQVVGADTQMFQAVIDDIRGEDIYIKSKKGGRSARKASDLTLIEPIKAKEARAARKPPTYKNPTYEWINQFGGIKPLPREGWSRSELLRIKVPAQLIRKEGATLDVIATAMERAQEKGEYTPAGTLDFYGHDLFDHLETVGESPLRHMSEEKAGEIPADEWEAMAEEYNRAYEAEQRVEKPEKIEPEDEVPFYTDPTTGKKLGKFTPGKGAEAFSRLPEEAKEAARAEYVKLVQEGKQPKLTSRDEIDLFGKTVRRETYEEPVTERPEVEKPTQRELGITPGADTVPKYPGGYDERGMRSFSNVNAWTEKSGYPLSKQGYVIEYGHTGGKDGWARIVDKKEPGEGKLISKAKPGAFVEKAKPPQLKLKSMEEKTLTIPERVKPAAKEKAAEKGLREILPDLFKAENIPEYKQTAFTIAMLKNWDPTLGEPPVHYLRRIKKFVDSEGNIKTKPVQKRKDEPTLSTLSDSAQAQIINMKPEKPKFIVLRGEEKAGKVQAPPFIAGEQPLTPPKEAERKALKESLRDVIEKMPGGEQGKQIVKGHIIEGKGFAEIGREIGLSRQGVSQQFNRVWKKIPPEQKDIIRQAIKGGVLKYMMAGPGLTPEDIKWWEKWLTNARGLPEGIITAKHQRIANMAAERFDASPDGKVLKKYMFKHNNNPAIAQFMSDFLRGRVSLTDLYAVPENVKQAAVNMRDRMDKLSRIILSEGNLPEETQKIFEDNVGNYLVNKFQIYENPNYKPSKEHRDALAAEIRATYPEMANATDDQVDNFLWAVRHKANYIYQPPGGGKAKTIPTALLRRRKKHTKAWENWAGKIEDPAFLSMYSVTKQAGMAYTAEFLGEIASTFPELHTADKETAMKNGWSNSKFAEDGLQYGKLRGKWVAPQLYEFIMKEVEPEISAFERGFVRYISNPFKMSRTVLQIPTHPRNFMGNFAFAFLMRNSLQNPLNLPYYFRAMKFFTSKHSPHKIGGKDLKWSDLIRDGVTDVQFWGGEVQRFHDKLLKFDPVTWSEKIQEFLLSVPKKAVEVAGSLYNFEDAWYRVAAHIKNIEHFKMTPKQSVEEINRGMTNYRLMPAAVDWLRKYPFMGPFISFNANVVKITLAQADRSFREMQAGLGYGEPIDGKGGARKTLRQTESGDYSEHTEHKPHPKTWWKGFKRAGRLLTVLALPEIASRISRKLADVSEEDIKELDKYRSEWRRYGTFLYFRKNRKLNALDLTFINPWGQLLRSVKITNDMRRDILSGRMTGLGALGESINFMAHPVFDMFSILLLGRKPGYGQKLPETDNEIKNLFNRVTEAVKYVWMPQSLPIPSIKHLAKEGKIKPGALTTQTIKGILDAYWGKASPLTGQGKELNREVIAFFSGLRTWEVDFESMIVRYQVGLRAKLSETQRNLSTWAKQKVVAKEVKGRKEYELAITPWEKAEKIKEIQGQLERLGKLFEESSKLLEKLRKGGI